MRIINKWHIWCTDCTLGAERNAETFVNTLWFRYLNLTSQAEEELGKAQLEWIKVRHVLSSFESQNIYHSASSLQHQKRVSWLLTRIQMVKLSLTGIQRIQRILVIMTEVRIPMTMVLDMTMIVISNLKAIVTMTTTTMTAIMTTTTVMMTTTTAMTMKISSLN
jgi:hypothetical protein